MARYYFDVEGSGEAADDTGTECAGPAEVRRAAMKLLPSLVRDEVPEGDRRLFSLIVRDEARRPVFAATLSLVGTWLTDDPPNPDW